ncbi:uncharacterized protein PRCAT00004783001 [Priceomyces carsonii]|uniref:uncharacterized protein n=1 Tax=Priceomyces carsonii TaxID=28549 RepID=UPI002EDAC081|nr:unnamed protein product [Priceomyces carsonii]
MSSKAADETVIELDKKKQITVRKFNNVNLVDIREFYIDKNTNEKKPGKKGISLTEDSWTKLLEAADQVKEALDKLNGGKKRKVEDDVSKSKKIKSSEKVSEEDDKDEESEED